MYVSEVEEMYTPSLEYAQHRSKSKLNIQSKNLLFFFKYT